MYLRWRKSWSGDSGPFFATTSDPQAALIPGLDALREAWQLYSHLGERPLWLVVEVPNPLDDDDPRETELACVAAVPDCKDFANAAEWWDENCAELLREAVRVILATQTRNDYNYPF